MITQIKPNELIADVFSQSSIATFFKIDRIAPTEQAQYEAEFETGVTFHPGIGPTSYERIKGMFIVPTGYFEHESGFPLSKADVPGVQESHRRRIKNANLGYIEGCGWDIVSQVVSDRSFPVVNMLNLGEDSFTRQLMGRFLSIAVPYAEKGYVAQVWCSNKSMNDFKNWDINTAFDMSSPLEDRAKLPFVESGSFRGIPVTAIERLQVGTVFPHVDLIYMTLHKPDAENPDYGFVMPLRQAVEGVDVELLDNPYASYDCDVRTCSKFQAGFACINPELLYVGIINRKGQNTPLIDSATFTADLSRDLDSENPIPLIAEGTDKNNDQWTESGLRVASLVDTLPVEVAHDETPVEVNEDGDTVEASGSLDDILNHFSE